VLNFKEIRILSSVMAAFSSVKKENKKNPKKLSKVLKLAFWE